MTGVGLLLVPGEMDEKPTRSVRFACLGADTGCGAANWVLDVVVDVGGAMEGKLGAEVCTEGVADWKSSKSSSSAVLEEAAGVGAAIGAEAGIGSSNEKRSTSGAFFLGGSDFLGVFSLVRRFDDVSAFLRPGVATAPSSYSSYSSNLSRPPLPRVPESWKSLA